MAVDTKHPDYISNIPEWNKTRAASAGSKEIKEGRTNYLPMPQSDDQSAENKQRYSEYLDRALYVNFTGATKDGMLGMIFRNDIEVELPTAIEYIETNADGAGLSLDQLTRSLASSLPEVGRDGLLTDYPAAEEGLTSAQVNSMGLQASIKRYPAESIINWRTEIIGGQKTLTMIMLAEHGLTAGDDCFAQVSEINYRALLLVDGAYTQRIYNEELNQVGEDIVPRMANGSVWRKIPFTFVGSINNDEVVDKAPLADLADVNIAHYRNSADNEESSFIVGQPTPWASGLSQTWVDDVLKGEVRLGSRGFLPLPDGGSAGLLQAGANTMPQQGMLDKEQQMLKIGARLITDNTGQETAEAARIRFAGQNSKLALMVGNIEAALIKSCEYVAQFMGGEGDIVIKINRDFYSASADPQMVMAQIQLLDRGIIAKTDLRGNLRGYDLIGKERTDDEIDSEAESLI